MVKWLYLPVTIFQMSGFSKSSLFPLLDSNTRYKTRQGCSGTVQALLCVHRQIFLRASFYFHLVVGLSEINLCKHLVALLICPQRGYRSVPSWGLTETVTRLSRLPES